MQNASTPWQPEAVATPMIRVRSYAFTRRPLYSLLKEARKVYNKTRPQMITIRVLDVRGVWRKVAYKSRRPLSSIIMDDDKREELLKDAREFLKSEEWYGARGLRWNRGYLLFGAPGTGKSSTIQALASEIKLDVYIIAINSPTMNDNILASALRSIPPKSLVVMEDIDAIFSTQKRNLDSNASKQQAMRMSNMPMPMGGRGYPHPGFGIPGGNSLSLSAILNALDGVESNEGRLLIMTTNVALSELDAALTRPGRCDLFVEYFKASKAQAEELFTIFYSPAKKSSTEESGLEGIAEETTEDGPEASKSSSYSPASTSDEEGHSNTEKKSKQKKESRDSKTRNRSRKKDSHHPFQLAANVTPVKIATWGKDWASLIEDGQFTIAELQGMLLGYKKDPEGAAQAMPEWISSQASQKRKAAELEEVERVQQEQQDKEDKAKEQDLADQKQKTGDKDPSPVAAIPATPRSARRHGSHPPKGPSLNKILTQSPNDATTENRSAVSQDVAVQTADVEGELHPAALTA